MAHCTTLQFRPWARSTVDRKHQHLILLSPIASIGLGQLVARVTGPRLGPRVWGLLFLGFWATLGALIAWGGGKKAVTRWPIAAHALVNLLSLTVAMILNLYLPGSPT